MLKAGDEAPVLTLAGDDGQHHTLGGDAAETTIVYFYPKDDTPGCTIEARDFSAAYARLAALGARVFGVSKDSVASHCRFRDKHGLTIRLLSDPDLAAHRAFGAYGEKTMYGKKVLGTIRSTFVLRGGKVAFAYPNVKVAGHVDAVIAALGGAASPTKRTKADASAEKPAKKPAKKAAAKSATKKTTAKKTTSKKGGS